MLHGIQSQAGQLSVPYQLAGSAAAQTAHTGTTNETTIVSVTVPAGLMGANGTLAIFLDWTHTSSGNSKTLRTRFSTISGTIFLAHAATTTTHTLQYLEIANRNSAASQVGGGFGNRGSDGLIQQNTTLTTASVDTAAADTTLVFTAQLANSGETITLERYRVELIRGA